MPNKTTKRQLITEFARAHCLQGVGPKEIRAIDQALRQQFGPDRKTSYAYIATVLREAGTRVDYSDHYVDPCMDEPYADRLKGLLQFRDLESAEASLEKLDAVYRAYRSVSDRVGTSLVRSLALKGKQRAESLASNRRVGLEKRREKKEIACWFKVWLEVSDLFFDWLELRKQSEDFRQMFGRDGQAS